MAFLFLAALVLVRFVRRSPMTPAPPRYAACPRLAFHEGLALISIVNFLLILFSPVLCRLLVGSCLVRLRRGEGALGRSFYLTLSARLTGLEPATTGSTVQYSNQLSYSPCCIIESLLHPTTSRWCSPGGDCGTVTNSYHRLSTTILEARCRKVICSPFRLPRSALECSKLSIVLAT